MNNNTSLTIADINQSIKNGGVLLDVRTAEEYADSHIEGAINLSLQDILAGSVPAVSKDQPVYVYCRGGVRSSQSQAALNSGGYTNVVDLGGMMSVQAIGGKLVN